MDITDTALNILYGFYRSRTNRDLRFIATEMIEDTISEINKKTDAQTNTISNVISESEKKIISSLSENVSENSLMSLDVNAKLLHEGKISQVEANLASGLNALSCQHSLYPDYKLEFDNKKGRFYSKPVNEESLKKFPPQIIATASVKLDEQVIEEVTDKVVDYANRHQLPITVDILTAEKYLGNFKDPIQHEADDCIGEKIVIPPRPFPPAFPCSVSIDNEVVFEYILLRTQEVLDDGRIVMSNIEQNDLALKFSMTTDIVNKSTNYCLEVNSTNNSDILKFLHIIRKAYSEGTILVKNLETGKEFAKGKLNNVNYSGDLDAIEKEIEFLENIVSIEQYFNQPIIIPSKIDNEDVRAINFLVALIKKESYETKWTKFEFPISVSDNFKSKILDSNGTENNFAYVGTAHITLFDVTYTLSIVRMFGKIKYENFSKLKQKAEILDVGDEIKISIVPAENEVGIIKDILNTEIKVDELI